MVDFVSSDGSQSGVDARIDSRGSVVQSVLEAVQRTSAEATIGRDSRRGDGDAAAPPPLYEFVNPDALEALYAHAQDHGKTARWTTTFEYADSVVSVTSAGTVTVETREADQGGREHGCPRCGDAEVDVSDDRFVVGATLQCPECGHEWDITF